MGNELKKQRNEHLYNLMKEVNKEFSPVKRLKNIFLIDGTPIFDLVDILETEKCLLVCIIHNIIFS